MDSYGKQQEQHSVQALYGDGASVPRGSIQRRKSKHYKPAPIRWPTLLVFALMLAACIGLIEFVLGMSKPVPTQGAQNKARSIEAAPRQLIPRDDGDCTKLPALAASFTSANQAMASICSVYSQSYSGKVLSVNKTAAFNQWSDKYDQQIGTRYEVYASMTDANDDCYQYQMTTVAGYKPLPTPTTTYYQGCNMVVTTAGCLGVGVAITIEGLTVTESSYTAVCSAPQSKQLILKTKSTTQTTEPTQVQSNQLSLTTKTSTGVAPQSDQLSLTTRSAASTATKSDQLSLTTQSPVVSESPVTLTSVISSSSVIVTTGQNGVISSRTTVVVQTSLVSSNSKVTVTPSTTGSKGFAIPTSIYVPDMSIANLTSYEKYVDRPVTINNYVAAVYLPAILAVFIRVMWEMIHSAYKLVEPFHRLNNKGGASATQSLFAQYLSAAISWDSFGSCFNGHPLAAVTTVVYFAVTLLPSLASASMGIKGTDRCDVPGGGTMVCNPVWILETPFLRAAEALLILCFAMAISMTVLSKWYKTGIATDPSSIASVATLINQDALVQSFRSINPAASEKELAASLRGEHCWLGYHQNNTRGELYGIGCQANSMSYPSPTGQLVGGWNNGYAVVANPALPPPKPSKSRKLELMFFNAIQLVSCLAILGLVVAYYKDDTESAFNNFFNSGTKYSQFVFVFCASLVDMQWKRLEREVRITEPYRRMAKGYARPETTVLLSLHGSCWSGFYSAMKKLFRYEDMWFQTLVSFVAVLSDFNIIAFASIVFSEAQLPESGRIAAWIAMGITSLMVIVMLITIFWWSRGIVTSMPRSPSTVGVVFSYLCASRFAQEMGTAQLENMSQRQRNDMVIATGWRFSFGWRVGVDGVERWMVEFDPS